MEAQISVTMSEEAVRMHTSHTAEAQFTKAKGPFGLKNSITTFLSPRVSLNFLKEKEKSEPYKEKASPGQCGLVG